MAKSQRTKGARAQAAFADVLRSRNWVVDHLTSGRSNEDLIATDPHDQQWSVEVKDHKIINLGAFLLQARCQASNRHLPWMLACHLPGTSSWLVMRKNERAVIWHD